jgi:hypothetical protein
VKRAAEGCRRKNVAGSFEKCMAECVKTPLVSVVLCTYNPRADFVERVLEGLRRQTLPLERWEFIVVDNNSTKPLSSTMGPRDDGTTVIDLSWHPDARIVVETQQGLSHARRRGFQEAKGDLIVNLDDDAVLDQDYLEQSLKLAEQFPSIGAFGCQIHGEFEVKPMWPRQEYYGAERLVEVDIWSNMGEHFPSTPGGAGSVVRKSVARSYVEKMCSDQRWGLLGRSSSKLLSCEDIEIAMVACDLGLGKGVFRALNLTHLIPASKMTEDFHCRNAYGNGYSSIVHHYLRHGAEPPRPGLLARADRIYRLIRMDPRKRREELAKDRGMRDARRFVAELKSQEQKPSATAASN